MNKSVKVVKGQKGWGGPLILQADEKRNVVASITGGGIHPVAQKIADMLDVPAIDAFNSKVEPENMIAAIIDCGGTARCGVYPKLNVLTVDLHAVTPSGPLVKFINEKNFVSGVTLNEVLPGDGSASSHVTPVAAAKEQVRAAAPEVKQSGMVGLITRIGRSVGRVVGIFYQAGRDSIDMVIKNIIPFMAFVSVFVGVITYTGIGNWIAEAIKPLAGNIFGLLILSVIIAIPFLSPILGPGAVIAQIIGVLLGVEIGKGTIPPSMALPALFAINPQVGGDFVPVGLTLAEAEPYTVEIGVPAVLFSRLVTGPIAVFIAWLFSFGLY